jgi:hypothetical protein
VAQLGTNAYLASALPLRAPLLAPFVRFEGLLELAATHLLRLLPKLLLE